jgi:hypothetical protein
MCLRSLSAKELGILAFSRSYCAQDARVSHANGSGLVSARLDGELPDGSLARLCAQPARLPARPRAFVVWTRIPLSMIR